MLLFWFMITSFILNETQYIILFDANQNQVISDAYVFTNQDQVLVSSASGKVVIPEKVHHLTISHINYETYHANFPFPDTLFLETKSNIGETVLIVGERNKQAKIEKYNDFSINQPIENQLKWIEGLQLIQRGAFATEPSIRGLSDQRINVSVDGMRIYAACTDKMDPPTSYLDTENVQEIAIQRGSNSAMESGSGYAGIHIKTQKARFFDESYQISTGFRNPDSYRFLTFSGNQGWENQAIRTSFSYKSAHDFEAGGEKRISGSGFSKINTSINHRALIQNVVASTSFVYDNAWEMGFPVLLMDATRATAFMARQEWQFVQPSTYWHAASWMYYYNQIHHKMDDYSRDVTQRSVMKNMYMPMEGKTQTFGTQIHLQGLFHTEWNTNLELIQSTANGFMLMEPLDKSISPMYLDNLADVITRELKWGFSWQKEIGTSLQLNLNQAFILNSVFSQDKEYVSYFEDLYNRTNSDFLRVGNTSQLELKWNVASNLNVLASSNYAIRPPNHNETFSHYVYNYTDGFFYEGNPWLSNEKSWNNELQMQLQNQNSEFKLSGFYRLYDDYIAGVPNPELSSDFYAFMNYKNVGKAHQWGFESRFITRVSRFLEIDSRISYTRGYFDDLRENMPFISPLSGLVRIQTGLKSFQVQTTWEWATAQNHIAKTLSVEDKTKGFSLFNTELRWINLTKKVTLNFEIQNILDTYIVRHTSIGNLPERGRSFSVGLSLKL